jgi:hypothetical protein
MMCKLFLPIANIIVFDYIIHNIQDGGLPYMGKRWTASEMGRKGGAISKRVLTTEQSLAMIKAREKNRKKLAAAKNKVAS